MTLTFAGQDKADKTKVKAVINAGKGKDGECGSVDVTLVKLEFKSVTFGGDRNHKIINYKANYAGD